MSLKPTAVIAPVSDFEASDLPISEIALDGTASTPSTGATSITSWMWSLHSKPSGSTAQLVNQNTATPTLADVNMVGSYLISLQVTDNLGRSSHSGIEPVQATTAPYSFSFPDLSSMLAIRVKTAGGLVKVAYGEREWLSRGLWELVDRLDLNSANISNVEDILDSGDVYADNIYERTTGHGIIVHNDLKVSNIIAAPTGTGSLLISAEGPASELGIYGANIVDVGATSLTVKGSESLYIKTADTELSVTQGPDGPVMAWDGAYDAGISVDNNLALAAGSNIVLTAVEVGISSGDVTSLALNQSAISSYVGKNIISSGLNDVSLRAGISNNSSDPGAKIEGTFSSTNKRRVIDLDGFIASKNEKFFFAPGPEVTPGSSEVILPFYSNEEIIFDYEALIGSGSLPFFGINFEAGISLEDFQHAGGSNTVTFKLKAQEISDPTTYDLLSFTLNTVNIPSFGVTSFTGSCRITGQLGCQAQKTIYASGSAFMSGSALEIFPLTGSYTSDTFKCDTGSLNVASIIDNGKSMKFFFTVSSTDASSTFDLKVITCSFRFFRGS